MKKTILALSLAAMTLPAMAQKAAEPDYTIEGNLGLFTDYKFRGISQTEKNIALQGGFDLTHKSGFYLGTWASNVSEFANFNDDDKSGSGLEIDVYGGYATELASGIGIDVGVLRYQYPGSAPGTPGGSDTPHTTELYLGLSYGIFSYKFSRTAGDWFSYADSKGSTYHSLDAEYTVNDNLSLTAHYGKQKVKGAGNPSYSDYSVGISYALPNDFSFGLAYVGTSGISATERANSFTGTDGKNLASGSAIASISKSF
jgi:uncharacterized protein (TIGR02001 family)